MESYSPQCVRVFVYAVRRFIFPLSLSMHIFQPHPLGKSLMETSKDQSLARTRLRSMSASSGERDRVRARAGERNHAAWMPPPLNVWQWPPETLIDGFTAACGGVRACARV